MTNSFRPQASPVDTFVSPSTVAPTTGFDQLVNALKTVNPSINQYIDLGIKKEIRSEQAKGKIAAYKKYGLKDVSDASDNFGQLVEGVRKKDGDEAAKQLVGGTIFFKDAYQKNKAALLGADAKTNLLNAYSTETIDGQPIRSLPMSDPRLLEWVTNKNQELTESLDVDEHYAAEFFFPQLEEANNIFFSHHQKEHNLFNVELLQGQATETVQKAYLQYSTGNKELAAQTAYNYITNVRKLLKGKNYTEVQDIILDDIFQIAEIIGFASKDGDQEAQAFIDEFILYFPAGKDGKQTLANNKNFLNLRSDLLFKLDKFTKEKNKRIKAEQLEKNLQKGRSLLLNPETTAEEYNQFKIENPLITKDLDEFAVLARPDSDEEYFKVEGMIQRNEFTDPLEAEKAARNWYNSTLKTPNDKSNLIRLGTAINRNVNGSSNPIRQSIKRITDASDELLKDQETDLLNQDADIAKVDIDDFVQKTMFDWFYGFKREGKTAVPTDEEIVIKEREVKKEAQQRALDFIRGQNNLTVNVEQLRDTNTTQRLLRIKQRIQKGTKQEPSLKLIAEQANVSLEEVTRLIGPKTKETTTEVTTPITKELTGSNESSNSNTPGRPDEIPIPYQEISSKRQIPSNDYLRINKVFDKFKGAVTFGSAGVADNLAKEKNNLVLDLREDGFGHVYADPSPPEVIAEAKKIYADLMTDTSLISSQTKLAIAQMVLTEADPNNEEDIIAVMSALLNRVARARLGVNVWPNDVYKKDIIEEIMRPQQFAGVTGFTREQLINAKPIKKRETDLRKVIYVLFSQPSEDSTPTVDT